MVGYHNSYIKCNFVCSGRPEKLPDVCYSWWVLASLSMIGRIHWIDKVTIYIPSHEM